MVIHFPSEPGEVPWLLIGFSGQISVLSGISSNRIAAFQHMMSDVSPTAPFNKAFEPVWFSMRKALEADDFNSDGLDDTNDVHDALLANVNGYADGYIVASLAPSSAGGDSLTGVIAELASAAPLHTFRSCCYNDSIMGENIYAANSAIARNNVHHYCSRYLNVIPEVGTGSDISSSLNWSILRDFSNSGSGNIQFMQYIPEESILRLSLYHSGTPAYLNDSLQFDTDSLFTLPIVGIPADEPSLLTGAYLTPNPASGDCYLNVSMKMQGTYSFCILDIRGKELYRSGNITAPAGAHSCKLPLHFSSGIYICRVTSKDKTISLKLIKK